MKAGTSEKQGTYEIIKKTFIKGIEKKKLKNC